MKNNSLEIKKSDFEQYRIPISLGNYLPKAKKKFIWEELEKRHPCFSNNFTYFIKNKLCRNGVVADVFVIEKSILGDYKNKANKNPLSINGVKLTEQKFNKKNIFFLSLIFIMIFIFLGLVYGKKTRVVNDKIENINISEEKTPINFMSVNKDLVIKLYDVIKENNGYLRKFNWKIALSGEYINGTVCNVFPEKIEEAINSTEIKTTKYIDKEPFFDFSIRNKFALEKSTKLENSKNILGREVIRNYLIKENIPIIEEISNPYRISFLYCLEDDINSENKVLMELGDVLKSEKLYITGMTINLAENKELVIEMNISADDVYENNAILYLSKIINLFKSRRNIVPVKLRKNTVKLFDNINNNKKLGDVYYTNGKRIMFFRTPEGKIIREVIKNEE